MVQEWYFAAGLIKFDNGARLELNVSWVLHQEQPDSHNVERFGTEAGACLWPARLFRPGKTQGEYEVVEPHGVKVDDRRECRQFDWSDGIAGKRAPIRALAQALKVQQVLDAMYHSSATGKEVRIR